MNKKRALELMKIEQKCVKRQQCDRDCGKCELVQEQAELIEAFNMAIDSLEQDSVKRGVWLNTNEKGKLKCSCCDIVHFIAQYPFGKIKFCPNCGAKMDVEAENEE